MYINRVILYGNLTKDPELKALPGGTQVVNFSIATNRTFTGKDGKKQEQVEFHSIVAFARVAEVIAQYMRKGSAIYIEGRMQTRSWEKDGKKQYKTEIVVESMQFGPKSAGAASKPAAKADESQPEESQETPSGEVNPDDIPF